MQEITQEVYEALDFIRIESYRNFIYALAKDGDGHYVTISRYHNGPTTIQLLEDINDEIPKEQKLLEFVNDHASIHINPEKYIWKWRD